MLVGRRNVIDDREIEAANAAREAKWAQAALNKSRALDVAQQNADTDVLKVKVDAANADTSRMAQRETARANVATEKLTGTRDANTAAFQTGSLENDSKKIGLEALELSQKAPLMDAQAGAARAATEHTTAETGKIMSGLRMRNQYLSPETSAEDRARITGVYQAEAGLKPADTTHVIPGQKVTGVDANNRPVERLTPPLIVDEGSGTYRETKQTGVFTTAEDKLKSFIGTPQQKEAETEYIKRYGSLPAGYKGGK